MVQRTLQFKLRTSHLQRLEETRQQISNMLLKLFVEIPSVVVSTCLNHYLGDKDVDGWIVAIAETLLGG